MYTDKNMAHGKTFLENYPPDCAPLNWEQGKIGKGEMKPSGWEGRERDGEATRVIISKKVVETSSD